MTALAIPKKLYPEGVSFWRDQMRFERIAGYDVTVHIGEGGVGQVYRATDTQLVVLNWAEESKRLVPVP